MEAPISLSQNVLLAIDLVSQLNTAKCGVAPIATTGCHLLLLTFINQEWCHLSRQILSIKTNVEFSEMCFRCSVEARWLLGENILVTSVAPCPRSCMLPSISDPERFLQENLMMISTPLNSLDCLRAAKKYTATNMDILKLFEYFFFSNIYTQYPIMTKWKQCFRKMPVKICNYPSHCSLRCFSRRQLDF